MNWSLTNALIRHFFPGVDPGKLTLRRYFDLDAQIAEIARLKRGGKAKRSTAPRPFGEGPTI